MNERVHIFECAKAKIKINEFGEILSVEDPLIQYCPIREYSGWHSSTLNKFDIIKSMEWKIKSFNLCTKNRILRFKLQGIGYGASELLMTALSNQIIEAAVIPCEGAGSIITTDKFVVQGIGIVTPALLHTFPMSEISFRLKQLGAYVVDTKTARIDQVNSVKKAYELGYKTIGVTVAGHELETVETLRRFEYETSTTLLIILIHTTGVTIQDEQYILQSDISHGCSSKFIREILESKNKHIAKYGTILPVYAFSELGKDVLYLRDQEMQENPPLFSVKQSAIKRPPFPLI
ncbi:MAG: DUF2099 family protein [Promethearchaeota archaeon]|nr:MAG: DUF2099 family protein [Candidatus Lokiarchaeota archaeon]